MTPAKYLVIFYGVSAGQNGPNLGSDEQDLVMLIFLVINTEENKIVGIHKFPVSPAGWDINENILSEEVSTEFGITENDVKGAPPLSAVIRQFDSLARDVLSGPENLTLVTDGQLHLRQCLWPEVTRKNLSLPPYFSRFHDLRKEFQSQLPTSDGGAGESLSVEEMLKSLNLPEDDTQETALRTVNNMARVVMKMLADGRKLHEPEEIMQSLEPGIRSRSEQVDTNSVVRARGLPWQASDTDIARFFTGLNVSPGGVALCLSPQGRRNGEALVLFENISHRDMALRRHKHHIGNRYIEVYKATGEDFINVAGGNNSEAQEFLSRGGQVIIRMRGLPYDCSAKQVIDFFNGGEEPCEVLDEEHGVLFVKKPDGRATGDAFVLFKEETEGDKALLKHKDIIGSRYIELFRSTTAEVQQVLNRSTESGGGAKSGLAGGGGGSGGPLIPSLPPSLPAMTVIPQQLITAGTRKDCIRLRGLPYEAQVENILEFLGEHAKNIIYQGVHMVFNAQGQPSGEAFIQMDSEASAFGAANSKHHRYMVFGKKQRYIEVFQCSGEDMSVVLTGGGGGQQGKVQSGGGGGGGQQGGLVSPGAGGYPAYSPLLGAPRPPPPASFSHFPAQMLYWPACGYPSPPISPNNYYVAGGHLPPPSSLLSPTSSISNLTGEPHLPPSQDLASPSQPAQNSLVRPTTQPSVRLTDLSQLAVETTTVKFPAVRGERQNTEPVVRSSVYIH